jgi:hypothetical protein
MQILFNKTLEQCRQLGARGGRAHARNLRLRQSQPPLQPGAEIPGPPSETAHEASLRLDAQFPWLAAAFAPGPTLRARLASGGHHRSTRSCHSPRLIAGQPVSEFPGTQRAHDLPTLA